ncbi:hypothetical protein EKK58_09290 [Candidatus Dependentiae bacterium]|nr:MAG: hypothetical protein EKK58_09290 [Candidatus Dependentiae bacterium]
MARAAPAIRSLNAGEQSPLMDGRTDTNNYPASSRKMYNTVAAPQGPAIPRSGTEFINSVYKHNESSTIIPFIPTEDDFYMLEFANGRMRVFTEVGVLTYAPVAMTVTDDSPFKFDSATLGANIGDEVAFSLFPDTYNLNGVVGKIVGKVGTVYEMDISHPALPLLATAKVSRVYHIDSPYVLADLDALVDIPSLDVVYLVNGKKKTYKLKRNNTYDWAFEEVAWSDGPYMATNEEKTLLTPSATGKATPDMTADNLPSGYVASGSSFFTGQEYYKAFDDPDAKTYWQSNTDQTGTLQIELPSAIVADGYSLRMAINNSNSTFISKDYAPLNFTFEGSNNGSTWDILDRQNTYVVWDNNKSLFFRIPNVTAYKYYRIVIDSVQTNGAVKPCLRGLVIRSTASTSMTITASSTTGINNNAGFKSTDVGRFIRMKADDGSWRALKITAYTNSTTVTATLLGEPFPNLRGTDKWRLGLWSETTGYPATGVFFQDRLWLGGPSDWIAATVVGAYENMAPTDDDGAVQDTSGICVRLNARKLSKIRWMVGVKRGLAVGTGSQEFIAVASNNTSTTKNITPGNITVEDCSARGSSETQPAPVDSQVLYVQRGGRTMREFAYSYEADNYKSPSMSILASHLGVSPFTQLAYAAEPYSIVWVRRKDGGLVGLTYNRDENVIGWHRHGFQDEFVERIAVMPSSDQMQDVLWMIIRRTIDGQTRRYIEKLTRFWDFGMTLNDAHFVDCGLRYEGDPIDEVYGLQHLEGREVYGVADTVPVGPFTVNDGMITLNQAASNIVIGLGFDSEGETSCLENGAQDGTAQGKIKRFNAFAVKVWESYGGEIGTMNEDTGEVEYVPLAEHYKNQDTSLLETIELFTGILGPITPAPGYEKSGSVFYRRKKDVPLPFNIVSLLPRMVTQDGG